VKNEPVGIKPCRGEKGPYSWRLGGDVEAKEGDEARGRRRGGGKKEKRVRKVDKSCRDLGDERDKKGDESPCGDSDLVEKAVNQASHR